MTTIILRNNMYQVQFPYDSMMVQMLKSNIPGAGRRWDNNNKVWQVDTQYESVLKQLFPNVRIPAASQVQTKPETRMIDVRYVGQVKDRGNGECTAFGFVNKEWSVIFPEKVLRFWFEGGFENGKAPTGSTLYGLLGLPRIATEQEIKTGYRRMARQWHPDVCKEPNANEIFLKIKDAYEILNNPDKKSRYDTGLIFEASLKKSCAPLPVDLMAAYHAPLRCGIVLADGVETLGRFQIKTILAWEDIIQNGKTLVVSWIMGDSQPTEVWA
jgi:hypothetical protein